MIYYARINGETRKVAIQRKEDIFEITIGDEVFRVDHRDLEGLGSQSLLVNSRCYEASVAPGEAAKLVSISGEKFEIRLLDEITFKAGTPQVHVGHADEEIIRTPMPGVVVAIEVEEGQRIEAGAPVVIVEAMKMQNEIASVAGGTVREILIRQGDAVESNQKLVVVARG
ncbi:MAG: biotin/lipoyl-containing protein [bacterium]